jgi:hypothetical protein
MFRRDADCAVLDIIRICRRQQEIFDLLAATAPSDAACFASIFSSARVERRKLSSFKFRRDLSSFHRRQYLTWTNHRRSNHQYISPPYDRRSDDWWKHGLSRTNGEWKYGQYLSWNNHGQRASRG